MKLRWAVIGNNVHLCPSQWRNCTHWVKWYSCAKSLTFLSIGMSVQWWLAFRRCPRILFICQQLYVYYYCACLVCRKVMEPKRDLPNCLLGPCIVCMCNWKQKVWVWISALWLQIVMSVPTCTIVRSVWHLVVCLDFLVTSMFPNWNIRWPTSV